MELPVDLLVVVVVEVFFLEVDVLVLFVVVVVALLVVPLTLVVFVVVLFKIGNALSLTVNDMADELFEGALITYTP